MKKVLKTMLSDITPKSLKSFFEGVLIGIFLFLIFMLMSVIWLVMGFAISWLLYIPIDLGMLIVGGLIIIGIWINSAYERTR